MIFQTWKISTLNSMTFQTFPGSVRTLAGSKHTLNVVYASPVTYLSEPFKQATSSNLPTSKGRKADVAWFSLSQSQASNQSGTVHTVALSTVSQREGPKHFKLSYILL